jgi:hypothetical protein
MKPFHYHEDPMYAAAAAILAGKTVNEEAVQLDEASAATTLDDFRSAPEIIGALLKLPGVKDHLSKIKAKPYFDDSDFVVGSKTAIAGALFNPKVKLADLAKAVMADEGDSKKADAEAMPNRVIVSVGNEAGVRKILDMVKANNAKAASKDMKVTAQKFARKGGFKVYITGNTVKAIGPYKSMAEAVELDEGVEDIAAAVANFKKGDKTNFGVVTDVGSNSITFKAKDLPVTKIPFNHRKMGSKDFTLDQLVKLKEDVSLEEGVGDYSVKKTGSSVSKGEEDYEQDVTTTNYNILKGGKTIGNLTTNNFMGGVYGKMYGKDLPDLEGYGSSTSSGVLGKLHKFLKSKTGMKWMAKNFKEDVEIEEAEIKSDKEFIEYSKQVLKAAHGDKYDDEKAMKTAQGILDKSDGDYGAAVGMLTSGLSEGTMGMGTATITAPGNKLHGKQVRIFHKFADGRLNVQYVNSNKKGDLWNMTLTKDQYKLD